MADVFPDPRRRFLLGTLSADAMDALGARLVADDAFGDDMAEAEDALIADYLAGALAAGDREAFERTYLATPTHRARVATVRALAARGEQAAPTTAPLWQRARTWLAAAAALVISATGLWWSLSRAPRPDVEAPPASMVAAQNERPRAEADSAPPEAAPDAPGMPVVALALSPLMTRGAGGQPSVQVPRGTAQVRLLLGGELPPADVLTAEISAVDRDDVRRWPVDDAPAAAAGASRAVTVPVYTVPAGDYILTVWQGDADLVQRYAFRVVVP